jgi:hypothetical protein
MAEHSQFQLLRERRFAPFFWTQFLGAGNDNVYKNALVIFVAFQAATLTAFSSNDLVNIAAAVFIAPFMLFSATAGQLADKYEKSRLIRLVKIFEIGIMIVGAIGFYRRDLVLLFVALGLMGVHSTLFGPVGTRFCRNTCETTNWLAATGWSRWERSLRSCWARSWRLGSRSSPDWIYAERRRSRLPSPATLFRAAFETPAVAPALRINWNPFTETWRNPLRARQPRRGRLAMLGILVLVLWRDLPDAVRQLHQGRARRRRARRDLLLAIFLRSASASDR